MIRPRKSKARMPVSMEFSMARRKLVSATSAFWAWMRLRVWRQLPINIHAVITLRTLTNQNKPPPTKPCEVRQAWARKIRSLPTGETGTS